MADKRHHRGQHPNDKKLFHTSKVHALREAVFDLSWLLAKCYPMNAALKLVGDRHRLTDRQRKVVYRSACAAQDVERRTAHRVAIENLRGKSVCIDGYNLLITVESALSGGYVFKGVDGCYRDLSSVHGSYRKVEETLPALTLIGEQLQALGVVQAQWYFDAPVSNSGRLKTILYELATAHEWPWQVDLLFKPDEALAKSKTIVITSDSWILDHCEKWANLTVHLIDTYIPKANVIDLSLI